MATYNIDGITIETIGNAIDTTAQGAVGCFEGAEVANNHFTSFEIVNLNHKFEQSISGKELSNVTPTNMSIHRIGDTYGLNAGISSTYFGNTVALYDDGTDKRVIKEISNIKKLLWREPPLQKATDTTNDSYIINIGYNQPMFAIVDENDPTNVINPNVKIHPFAVSCIQSTGLANIYAMVDTYNDWGNTTSRVGSAIHNGRDNDIRYVPTMPDVTLPSANSQHKEYVSTDGGFLGIFDYSALNYAQCNFKVRAHTEEQALFLIACFGFMFKWNDTIYYPVVEQGCVTGYTDDKTKTGEWNDWHTFTDHENATEPIKRKTTDDGIDDMEIGFTSYENGLVDYYLIQAGTLKNVIDSISTQTTYPNLISNIVSLKSYGCTLNDFYAGGTRADPVTVGRFNTQQTATKLLSTKLSIPIASFTVNGAYGSITAPHFLDFAPYTKLEIYIPFCGTVQLPPEVMYNTITVHMVSDIVSGSCIGVVKCNGNIVAQKSGVIGTTVPFTANDSAQQNYAMLQGVMNSVAIGAQTMLAGATGNIAGIVSGAMSGVANIGQQIIAGNDNYTRAVGTTGDKSAYAMPKHCYLKRWRAVDVSDESYNRTYGRPCCKSKTLTAGDGFTIIDNARVSGGMTLAEKNEIENYMRTGIIL